MMMASMIMRFCGAEWSWAGNEILGRTYERTDNKGMD